MREVWSYKKLGDLCDVLNGLWIGKKEPFINVAVIRNTNFTKDCKLNLEDVANLDVELKQFSKRKLQKGDIIIEKSGGSEKQPVGRPILFNISEGNYSFSNFTATLRLHDSFVLPEFLYICLYSHYRNGETLKMQSKTTGLHNLDMKAYLRLDIPYISIPEQQAIVNEIDLLCSIIEKQKSQLKDLDSLAQSIFYEMFGDPIINEKGWEVKKYSDCFTIGSGGTPSKSVHEYWDNGTIPWIGSNMCQNSIIAETDGKFITEEGLRHSSAKMLEEGTVLVALVGATIGKVALLRTKTSTNQNIAFIKVNETKEFVSEYVFFHLMNQYDEFMLIGNGDFKMASQAFIKALNIMVPPFSLQHQFAERVEAIERLKQQVQTAIKDLETLLASRMQYWFE